MRAAVRANRWEDLAPPPEPAPDGRLSVVIPVKDPGPALDRTLAALAAARLDPERLEVIVVDDGSTRPVDVGRPGIEVRVVRQDTDGGFGAGRARNTGARAATGDVVLFLDSDIVVGPDVLGRVLGWWTAAPYSVVTGIIGFAEFDHLTPERVGRLVAADDLSSHLEPGEGQRWREVHFARTHDLTREAPDMFRVTVGALLGVDRRLLEEVGGFRELGIRGIEDVETGYRLQNAGGLMVVDRRLEVWHQGRRFFDSRAAAKAKREREPAMRDLLPLGGFRPVDHPVVPSVPGIVASLEAVGVDGETVERHVRAMRAVERRDVVLEIGGLDRVRSDDERVKAPHAALGPADPVPVRVRLTPEWVAGPGALERLASMVVDEGLGVVRVVDGGDEVATAVSTRALGRARLVGAVDRERCAEDLFGVRWLTTRAAGFRPN